MFLLDTVVLPDLRQRDRDPGLASQISGKPATDVFVSVVMIGEIERGIALQRSTDALYAASIATWLHRKRYERTLLPDSAFVTEIARGFTGHGGCGGR